MSHFSVLVVGDDVASALAPYDESHGVASHKEYLSAARIAGMAHFYDLDPTDLTALAARLADWMGHAGGVDDGGLYYETTENSDAKWDWWTIGGRWRGLLRLKPGHTGILSPPDDGRATADLPGRADRARKADIDFDAMREDAARGARETWALYTAAIHGTPVHRPLQAFLDDAKRGAMTTDEARRRYERQDRVRAFFAASALRDRITPAMLPEDFPPTEEEFVAIHAPGAIVTFAFVENGRWTEHADIGWWGLTTHARAAYLEEFEAMLARTPDDAMLTIVDCHT